MQQAAVRRRRIVAWQRLAILWDTKDSEVFRGCGEVCVSWLRQTAAPSPSYQNIRYGLSGKPWGMSHGMCALGISRLAR